MRKIIYSSEFFNIEDTLTCGQVFRFTPYKQGFLVFSLDKCAYAYNDGDDAVIITNDQDEHYFKNYFDLDRDYSLIYNSAISRTEKIIVNSAKIGKGIRILNQNPIETLFSFIVSQNNNIPRIKKTIESLSVALGEKREFLGQTYYSFPTYEKMANQTLEFYKSLGLGYRAGYVKELAEKLSYGFDLNILSNTTYMELKQCLIGLKGVGPKVADCVALFGYHKTDAFPVDTWIEKVYVEDFKGEIKDRRKISEFFVKEFGENSGYFQQYLFYFKRSKEKMLINNWK